MAKPKILQQLNAEQESKILLASDPSANMEAATKNYVDNSGGTFYAIVGSTSFEEINEALNKEKAVKAVYQDIFIGNLFYTSLYSSTLEQAHFFSFISIDGEICITCTPTGWSEATSLINLLPHSINERTYRPILVSTSEPTSSDGQVGDIWLVYEA